MSGCCSRRGTPACNCQVPRIQPVDSAGAPIGGEIALIFGGVVDVPVGSGGGAAPVVTIVPRGATDDNPATPMIYDINVNGTSTGTLDLTYLEDLLPNVTLALVGPSDDDPATALSLQLSVNGTASGAAIPLTFLEDLASAAVAPVVTIVPLTATDDNPATPLTYSVRVNGTQTGTLDLTFLEDVVAATPTVTLSLVGASDDNPATPLSMEVSVNGTPSGSPVSLAFLEDLAGSPTMQIFEKCGTTDTALSAPEAVTQLHFDKNLIATRTAAGNYNVGTGPLVRSVTNSAYTTPTNMTADTRSAAAVTTSVTLTNTSCETVLHELFVQGAVSFAPSTSGITSASVWANASLNGGAPFGYGMLACGTTTGMNPATTAPNGDPLNTAGQTGFGYAVLTVAPGDTTTYSIDTFVYCHPGSQPANALFGGVQLTLTEFPQ